MIHTEHPRSDWTATLHRSATNAWEAYEAIKKATHLTAQDELTPDMVDAIDRHLSSAHTFLTKSKAGLYRVEAKRSHEV